MFPSFSSPFANVSLIPSTIIFIRCGDTEMNHASDGMRNVREVGGRLSTDRRRAPRTGGKRNKSGTDYVRGQLNTTDEHDVSALTFLRWSAILFSLRWGNSFSSCV